MAAIGWIWTWLMLLGGVRAHLDHSVAPWLAGTMLLSGLIALPLLWNRETGLLRVVAPSGLVRAGLALLVLAIGGIDHMQDVIGLVPGIA